MSHTTHEHTAVAENRLLLFFADYWDDMWRRRQQLAWRLAHAGVAERVVYIERPLPVTSFVKFLVGKADRDGVDRWRRVLHNRSWMMSLGDELSVLTTFAPLPPLGVEPLFRPSERRRDWWLLRRLPMRLDMDRPIVWISHPQMSVEIIQALEPALLWYDCTEDFAAAPELPLCVQAQIESTDRWLSEHADILTAVSRTLYEEKRLVNPQAHWLPNAVDADLFLHRGRTPPVPRELSRASRPVLGFVGGLNDWDHDWDLLRRLAALRPDWTILLVGGLSLGRKAKAMLARHTNILCVGQKPYRDLPAYLIHSDVCFQFYRPGRRNDTRNSQKLFLYLAAGKPVVSTPSADVQAYVDFVSIVASADEFVKAVEKALLVNDDSRAKKRQAFAQQNSWAARCGRVLELLQSAL